MVGTSSKTIQHSEEKISRSITIEIDEYHNTKLIIRRCFFIYYSNPSSTLTDIRSQREPKQGHLLK